MIFALLTLTGVLLAFANGGNDNFKGVATLFGSGTANYRVALAWGTLTTLAGSLAAVWLAGQLLQNFSGKGLVDDRLVSDPRFAAAVALGAAATVLVATRVGMPVSTTHALVGALIGAGVAAGSPIDVAKLGGVFVLPLLMSPAISVIAAAVAYRALRHMRIALGVSTETCLCVGSQVRETLLATSMVVAASRAEQLTVCLGEQVECRTRYSGHFLGLDAESALNFLHYLSAGAVSFARGLNDTPKIAALLLAAPAFEGMVSVALIGGAMAIGGVAAARRVAETMSMRITSMNHGQGFTANAVTALIVFSASRFGLPVSTTHVSCGALFGIGAASGQARWRTIGAILAAWVTTLPLAAALGAASFAAVARIDPSAALADGNSRDFDELAVNWQADEGRLLGGLRRAMEFRRVLREGPADALGEAIEAFRDVTFPDFDRPNVDAFRVTAREFREQLDVGGIFTPEEAFAPFAGRWYGLWDQMAVDHHWSHPYVVQIPRALANDLNIERSVDVQYAWIGDGFGWNYLVTPQGGDRRIALGYVYHVKRRSPGVIESEFPHIGYVDGVGRIIWITTGSLFFEEAIQSSGQDYARYNITGFNYRAVNERIQSKTKVFQAVYTRSSQNRPPWRLYDILEAGNSRNP